MPESTSTVLLIISERMTVYTLSAALGDTTTGVDSVTLVSVILDNSVPLCIQLISGGGMPVAEQVKVTGWK